MFDGEREGGDSNGPSYDWVDQSILKISTKFMDSNLLDQFLSTTSFIKPDCSIDAVMADIYGHTDRVCLVGKMHHKNFSLYITLSSLTYL